VFAMVETREAVKNLDEIVSVEGLDGVYVGPSDLSLSMGKTPTLDPQEPEVLAAIKAICAGTRKRGKIAGVHTDGAKSHSTFRRGTPALHDSQRGAADGECRSRRCARGARPDGTGGRQDLLMYPPRTVIPVRGHIRPRIELGASQRTNA